MSPPASPTVHALMRSFAAMAAFLAAAGAGVSRVGRDWALAAGCRQSSANAIVDASLINDMGLSVLRLAPRCEPIAISVP